MIHRSMLRAIAVAGALALAPMPAPADTGETPPALDGARTVTAQEAQALIKSGAVAFDARRKAAFLEGHLPGAQSLAGKIDSEKKSVDLAAFGADKAKSIIIHGHGSDGWSAVYAVKGVVAAGFSKVHWMRGGWAEWSKAGLPVEK